MNSEPLSLSTPRIFEWHDLRDLVQGVDHPFAGLVAHAAVLGPPGGNVGHRQRVGMLTFGVAAFVADQVDLGRSPVSRRPSPPMCGSGSAT